MSLSVSVIIPTFKRWDKIASLVESLEAGARLPDEVLIINNDPEQRGPKIESGLPITIFDAGLGLNLAGARNIGWRAAKTTICVFIDDDNVVGNDTIERFSEAFGDDLSLGLIAPLICSGMDSSVWCAGVSRSMVTTKTSFPYRGVSIDRLATAKQWPTDDAPDAFAVRREALEQIGGFNDVDFPFHYDEADLCARLRLNGFKTAVDSSVRVWHDLPGDFNVRTEFVRSLALGGTERITAMVRSRVRFHKKYSRGVTKLTALGLFIPIWAGLVFLSTFGALSRSDYNKLINAVIRGLQEGYAT